MPDTITYECLHCRERVYFNTVCQTWLHAGDGNHYCTKMTAEPDPGTGLLKDLDHDVF